jgi:hypothetical protein
MPLTVFVKLTTGSAPFPQASDEAAFEQAWSAQSMLPSPGAPSRLTAAISPVWASVLKLMFDINAFSQVLFGVLASRCDTAIPGEPADPASEAFSPLVIVFELLVWTTSCPVFSIPPGTRLDWIVWGNFFLGPASDLAYSAAGKLIAELNENLGVGITVGVAVWSVIVLAIQTAVEDPPWQRIVANFSGQLPEVFKFLRLTQVAGQPPRMFFLLGTLSALDLIGNIVAAFTNMWANYQSLPSTDPVQA